MDALSRDDGVHYLMSWLRNRYLDLEVTRIGKALSEMFQKLRRKPGQSIRDYNAEYDRLHARLKEVGCMLTRRSARHGFMSTVFSSKRVQNSIFLRALAMSITSTS